MLRSTTARVILAFVIGILITIIFPEWLSNPLCFVLGGMFILMSIKYNDQKENES